MDKKYLLLSKIGSLIFVLIFLIIVFIKNNLFAKIMIIPFFVCVLCSLINNIYLYKGKRLKIVSYVYVFSFFTYWFGFLIYFDYYSIIKHEYILLLFSLLFWFGGIKFLLKIFNNNQRQNSLKVTKRNRMIFKSLIFISFIVGIILSLWGLSSTIITKFKTLGYQETKGYFTAYSIYDFSSKETTYSLTYTYEVDDQEYALTTDYGVKTIPDYDSSRVIKYNPKNPSEAIITGTSSNLIILLVGIIFTVASLPFIMLFFKQFNKRTKKKTRR